ncbi:hypothetical protein [Nostoc sp.]|uniref:hypothetical protein n=1 Tax=Nostoc sp. TaxID=1180 RepID=UPI002FFD4EDC
MFPTGKRLVESGLQDIKPLIWSDNAVFCQVTSLASAFFAGLTQNYEKTNRIRVSVSPNPKGRG